MIHTDLAADVTLSTTPNQKYVITSNPITYKFRLTNPASGFDMHTIIEIINHSDYDQTITSGGSFEMFHTNIGGPAATADILIERGQRALLTVSENADGDKEFFITNLSA